MRRTFPIILFVVVAFVAACKRDSGTDSGNINGPGPSIAGMNPTVVNPGTIGVEGRIIGRNFQGLMSVSLGEGVEVEQFQRLSDTEIYIFFSVSRDAVHGPRTVIVATNTGATNAPTLFSVGDNRVPEALFIIVPFTGIKDDPFRFDASRSNDDGGIVQYNWKFGDGKQDSGKVVTHSFNKGGNFRVTLSVTDNKNTTANFWREIEVAASKIPEASFTVNPSSGSIDTSFSFDASGSRDKDGRIVHYFWDFADGSSASGELVQHKFKSTGAFGVRLTVTDNSGERHLFSKQVSVGSGGGGGGGGNVGTCTSAAPNRGLIFGTVVGVNGFDAIVQFPSDATCANSFYRCGDMRKASPENFYGIVTQMTYLGNGQFSVHNNCPFRWPPPVGEQVFLIHKSCSKNFCP